jgi:hypothetical protein
VIWRPLSVEAGSSSEETALAQRQCCGNAPVHGPDSRAHRGASGRRPISPVGQPRTLTIPAPSRGAELGNQCFHRPEYNTFQLSVEP